MGISSGIVAVVNERAKQCQACKDFPICSFVESWLSRTQLAFPIYNREILLLMVKGAMADLNGKELAGETEVKSPVQLWESVFLHPTAKLVRFTVDYFDSNDNDIEEDDAFELVEKRLAAYKNSWGPWLDDENADMNENCWYFVAVVEED